MLIRLSSEKHLFIDVQGISLFQLETFKCGNLPLSRGFSKSFDFSSLLHTVFSLSTRPNIIQAPRSKLVKKLLSTFQRSLHYNSHCKTHCKKQVVTQCFNFTNKRDWHTYAGQEIKGERFKKFKFYLNSNLAGSLKWTDWEFF